MGMTVLIVGNVIDGVFIVGPFKTAEQAVECGTDYYRDEDWVAAPLHAPEPHNENALHDEKTPCQTCGDLIPFGISYCGECTRRFSF